MLDAEYFGTSTIQCITLCRTKTHRYTMLDAEYFGTPTIQSQLTVGMVFNYGNFPYM